MDNLDKTTQLTEEIIDNLDKNTQLTEEIIDNLNYNINSMGKNVLQYMDNRTNELHVIIDNVRIDLSNNIEEVRNEIDNVRNTIVGNNTQIDSSSISNFFCKNINYFLINFTINNNSALYHNVSFSIKKNGKKTIVIDTTNPNSADLIVLDDIINITNIGNLFQIILNNIKPHENTNVTEEELNENIIDLTNPNNQKKVIEINYDELTENYTIIFQEDIIKEELFNNNEVIFFIGEIIFQQITPENDKNIKISQSTDITGNLNISGSATISEDLYTSGNVIIEDLHISKDKINTNGSLDISGNVTINPNLNVKQTITATHLNVNRIRNNNNDFKDFTLTTDDIVYQIYDNNNVYLRLTDRFTQTNKDATIDTFKNIINKELIQYDLTIDDVIKNRLNGFPTDFTNFQIKLDLPQANDSFGNVITFNNVDISSVNIFGVSPLSGYFLSIETKSNITSSNIDDILEITPRTGYIGNITFTQTLSTINIGSTNTSTDYIFINGKEGLINFSGNLTIHAGNVREVVRELVEISSNSIRLNGHNSELGLSTNAVIEVNRPGGKMTTTFNTNGETDFDHNIKCDNISTRQDANIKGDATIQGDATIKGHIKGDATIQGNATIQNNLKVDGFLTGKWNSNYFTTSFTPYYNPLFIWGNISRNNNFPYITDGDNAVFLSYKHTDRKSIEFITRDGDNDDLDWYERSFGILTNRFRILPVPPPWGESARPQEILINDQVSRNRRWRWVFGFVDRSRCCFILPTPVTNYINIMLQPMTIYIDYDYAISNKDYFNEYTLGAGTINIFAFSRRGNINDNVVIINGRRYLMDNNELLNGNNPPSDRPNYITTMERIRNINSAVKLYISRVHGVFDGTRTQQWLAVDII